MAKQGENKRRIQEMVAEGKSHTEIASILGITPSAVSKSLSRKPSMRPTCPRCAKTVPHDSAYCNHCGASLLTETQLMGRALRELSARISHKLPASDRDPSRDLLLRAARMLESKEGGKD